MNHPVKVPADGAFELSVLSRAPRWQLTYYTAEGAVTDD